MKTKRSFYLIVIVVMLLGLLVPVKPVSAAAYGTKFETAIAYMNVGSDPASIDLIIFNTAGDKVYDNNIGNLPKNGASTLYVGGLAGLTAGFRGSATMSSSQPLVTALIQIPQSPTTVKNRPISSGFDQGSSTVLISTVLKNMWSTNSIFTIQNVDSVDATVTIKFIPVTGPTIQEIITLKPYAAKYYDMGQTTPITAPTFNGTVVATAVKAGSTVPGALVATSLEASFGNNDTYAFEGVAAGGTKIYLPSAFCAWGDGNMINSSYAVQNISETQNATVTVTYSSGRADGPHVIAPGAKRSFQGCDVNSAYYIGAAIVTSVGAEVVAMAKIGGNALSTAYVGLTKGYDKVALPYVRWTEQYSLGQRQQVNIAIQNVGSATIPAGGITVAFYDSNGGNTPKGTTTNPSPLPPGGKWSTNAKTVEAEFGYTTGGGGAIISGPAGSELAVMARAATYITSQTAAGEDYNAIPIN